MKAKTGSFFINSSSYSKWHKGKSRIKAKTGKIFIRPSKSDETSFLKKQFLNKLWGKVNQRFSFTPF